MPSPLDPRALSLRKEEVEAIVDVLEEDHDTVHDAAKAALKAALRLFQSRDWYAITSRTHGLSYGVYGTENEAVTKAEKGHSLGIGGELYITKIHSGLQQEAKVVELDKNLTQEDPSCEKCDHLASEHEGVGRCVAPVRTIRTQSGSGPAKPCKCRSFKKGERK